MPGRTITVHAGFDNEAGVWFVEKSDLHGLNVEGPTLEALIDKLPGAIADLLEEKGAGEYDTPLEVIAHQRSSVLVGRPN